tara:strand:- start:1429 stop:2103 length:675 start_codon:yes stop_codon:yes gene_type:complete
MKSTTKKTVYETLSSVNVNGHTESFPSGKKILTYLSWAWAWDITKQHYPEMTSKVYKNVEGLNYHHDGKTAWVETGVTIEGIEYIENLPVMGNSNQSLPLSGITSWHVNKSIQRSVTKAIARHGLGLYLYAGEDLPEPEKKANNAAEIEKAEQIAKDQNLINQYVHSVKKALAGETIDDSAIREVFSEIADDGDRLKSKVYNLLQPEEQAMVTEVMTKTTKEAA